MLLDLNNIELIKSKSKDLPPGGVWRTIKGHKVYIKDGEIIAGGIPGVTHQAASTAKKGTKGNVKKPKATTKGVQRRAEPKSDGGTATVRRNAESKTKKSGTEKPTKKQTAIRKGSPVVASNGTKGKVTDSTVTHYIILKDDGKTSRILKQNVVHANDSKPKGKANGTITNVGDKADGKQTKAKKPTAKSSGTGKPVSKRATKKTSEGGTKSKAAAKKGIKDIRTDVQKNRELAYDVGDKIGGARKDEFEARFKETPTIENLAALEDESGAIAEKLVTKKNLLPPFDFEQEHKNGVALETAIMKKLIFDRIAPAPSANTPEARKAYMVEMDKTYRHFAGIKDWDTMRHAIREFSDIARKGATDQIQYAERILSGNHGYTQVNTEYYSKRLEDGKKAKAMMDFDALGDKFNNFFTDYKSREASIRTVNKNMKDGWDKYLNPESKAKNGGTPKGGENRKWERRAEANHLRTGGKETLVEKPEDMVKEFGLRGVEFGHWVNDSSGLYHLKRCSEAFDDLADIIGIDKKDISLNGRLAIAFGARGKGGALAHYEPDRKVINMTKHGGAGSLAHEWGHALDNILYQYSHGGTESLGLASEAPMGEGDPKLSLLYENLMTTIRKPVPGEKGGVKKLTVDTEKTQFGSYLPKRREMVKEKGLVETLQHYTDEINQKYDRMMESVKENRRGFYKTPADINKQVAKYERERTRMLNQLPHEIAFDHYRVTGEHVKGDFEIPTGNSEYYQRMQEMDGKGKAYFAKGAEMFARVFESYVQEKLDKKKRYNNYLVHSTREKDVTGSNAPFPKGKERTAIFKALDDLLAHVTKGKALKKALIMEILASGSGDMTEELRKSNLKGIFDNLWTGAVQKETEAGRGNIKRNAYNIDWTSFDEPIDELLYIPLNRLRRVHQTEKATNWDKVVENINKMHRGEGLAPIVIGHDYDIIDGQHRWEASNSMSFTHVPCVVMRGTNEIDRQRAIEAYQEVWKSLEKSWDESKHPRDEKGRFTRVYHITSMKDFKHDPNYRNSGQEWGSGLYTTPAEGIEYWHKALQSKATGERHPYAVPLDISAANLIEVKDIPDRAGRAQAIMKKYGSGKAAIEALKKEEMEQVTGETYDMRPHEVAEYRVYAKANGFDGLIAHDDVEGYQIILFDDEKVKYHPSEDIYEVMKRVRQGNP